MLGRAVSEVSEVSESRARPCCRPSNPQPVHFNSGSRTPATPKLGMFAKDLMVSYCYQKISHHLLRGAANLSLRHGAAS